MLAIANGKLECVRLLLSEINIKDGKGKTALDIAKSAMINNDDIKTPIIDLLNQAQSTSTDATS